MAVENKGRSNGRESKEPTMNDAGRAVSAPTISPTDAVAEAACDNGRKILGFSPEQLTAACGLALMAIAVLSGCTWDNGSAGPRKVARITRNIKHDRRGERQMPDPGRQHRGREAFQPQPNEHRS